jgi:hypothetical protein
VHRQSIRRHSCGLLLERGFGTPRWRHHTAAQGLGFLLVGVRSRPQLAALD